MHTQWSSSLFNSPLEAGGRIFGEGDVGVPDTPIHVDVVMLELRGRSPMIWLDPGLATWGSRLTSAAASTQGQIFTPADIDCGRCVEIVPAYELGVEVIPAPNNDTSTAVVWMAARQVSTSYLGGAPTKLAGSATRGTDRYVGAPVGVTVLVRGGGDSHGRKEKVVTKELTYTKRAYFGDDESSIDETGMGWRAAAADCLGLTLQVMWKLTSLELVGFNLAVLLNQPWLISFLVVACFLGAQALARARDARKPGDGRNRCAQGRASAASPRQKTSLRQLGGATARLRPVLVLCHLSAVSSELATNVACVPYKQNEALLDFSGAKPQRFLHCAHPPRLSAPASSPCRRGEPAAQQPGRRCRSLLCGDR